MTAGSRTLMPYVGEHVGIMINLSSSQSIHKLVSIASCRVCAQQLFSLSERSNTFQPTTLMKAEPFVPSRGLPTLRRGYCTTYSLVQFLNISRFALSLELNKSTVHTHLNMQSLTKLVRPGERRSRPELSGPSQSTSPKKMAH